MNEIRDTETKTYAAKAMPTGKYVAVNVYMNKEHLEVGSCNIQGQQNKNKAYTSFSGPLWPRLLPAKEHTERRCLKE